MIFLLNWWCYLDFTFTFGDLYSIILNIAGIFKETSDGTSGVIIQPGFVSSSEVLTIVVVMSWRRVGVI